MKKIYSKTEEVIRSVARKEFITHGFAGARMQRIAKSANINSALLHYYFRSKENLFEILFSEAMDNIFEKLVNVLGDTTINIFKKIKKLIDNYTDFLMADPQLPLFVINEISINPERLINFNNNLKSVQSFAIFDKQIKNEIVKGHLKSNVNSQDVFANILSLTIFQFIAEPLFVHIFSMNSTDYSKFIEHRKEIIAEMINTCIKV